MRKILIALILTLAFASRAHAANLYAKAAGGNWTAAGTWSTVSSAGVDNSGPPSATNQDDCVLDAGSGNVTIDGAASCRSLDASAYTGTLTHASGIQLALGHTTAGPGNLMLRFGTGMTYTLANTTALLVFSPSPATEQTITTAGKSLGAATFNGAGISGLADNFTATGFTIASAGTINAHGFTLNLFTLTVSGCTVNLNGSTVNLTRTTTGNILTFTSGSVTGAHTIVISTVSANARTFAGGGGTFYNLTYTVAGSTGGLVVTGANTFNSITFSDITNARTLTLPASATTTINGTFAVTGTSGKLMSVISSSAGTAATISKAGGFVSTDYVSIKDSTATGGIVWYAGANSTNVSGNTGWTFTVPSTSGIGTLLVQGSGR